MPSAIAVGADAPEFELPASNGGVVRFAPNAGQHTLISFWKST